MTMPSLKPNNARIMLIGDLHAPYQHPDTLRFLSDMKAKYKPTRIICIGDEIDNHKISFHDGDPNLLSAGDEFDQGQKFLKKLEKIFPKMDILESNHGSLHFRKALARGLPKQFMMSYNDLWEVGTGWQWHPEIRLKLPNKQELYLHHGKGPVEKIASIENCNVAQGHYHEKFKINQWCNSNGERWWGMQVGCLIDNTSPAFRYNKLNSHSPVMGSAMVIDGEPLLVPMRLKKNGRYSGKL